MLGTGNSFMTAGSRTRRDRWASLLAIVTVVMLAMALLPPPPAYADETPVDDLLTGLIGGDETPDTDDEGAEPAGDDAEPEGDTVPGDDDTDSDEDPKDVVAPYGRVSGVVWVDADGDGTRQPDEGGLGGVELTLIDGNDTEVASTTSDASGGYGFEDVEPGVYLVRAAAASEEAVSESDPFEIVGDDEVTLDLGFTSPEPTEVPEADDEEDETTDPPPAAAEPIDAGDDEVPAVEALAAGPPVYEIEGAWVDPPATISRGNPVVGEWRVNVNDSAEPPSNDPVDNVTVEFNVDKAFFDEIPDVCLIDGVDPPSSMSDDRTMLTCNFGTVAMGTAIVVQTPVVADGVTGDEVTMDGTIDGQTVDLPPIPIANPFVMDIHYGTNTGLDGEWSDDFTYVDVDLQWSLRMGQGSDPGPDEVTYRLTVAGGPGGTGAVVGLAPAPGTGELGCAPFQHSSAGGHPWSFNPVGHNQTSFVDECILTPVAGEPGQFDLTLRGINYSLLNVPTTDSAGLALPTDWDYVASGALWFRVFTTQAGSITLQSNAPTYESPTGQEYDDPPGNNATDKPYTLPGNWAAWFQRSTATGGGLAWDDTYRLSAGSTLQHRTTARWWADDVPPGSPYGNCHAFDTRFVTLDSTRVLASNLAQGTFEIDTIPVEYYVGNDPRLDPNSAGYNPDLFDCGVDAGNWTTTPADPSAAKAVRILYPHSQFAAENADTIQLTAFTTIHDDVPVGQDIWMFGSNLRNGQWAGPGTANVITATPGARYPHTNTRRDLVRIISATPFIEKSSAQATVTPGVPSEFTLTYSANGSGAIPPTVDGYEIVDTLPLGMSYVPGSADPEPVVTVSGGQQVLTWTLDGVATNTENELTYEAVADTSVEPGTPLTNVAESSYDGQSSQPRSATVTTTTNGFTTILKMSDVDYIPNELGDGVGTGSWTVTIDSFDPLPQAFTDTIDILPYNGDQRGTSFTGTYTLDDVVLLNGGTVYYTDTAPTSLSDDPADPSNGSPGNPAGNTVDWTTTAPANPTAIRVIGGELLPGGTFGFQVVITTDGASMGDVYVNRAQARAEHTELVMRTSAALVVTDYVTVKTSDPESGSTVAPGDTVNYTITVTQQGPVPAGALFTDDWSDVLDDAVYNGDLATDLGTVSLVDGVVSWNGIIPVGGVATITYSMTLKNIEGLEAEGNTLLNNVVSSPGCLSPEDCETVISTGWYEYSKTSVPEPGGTVLVGEVITYNVEITQVGEGPVVAAWLEDDLSAVLDDATWNGDVSVPVGAASLTGTTLRWDGDLAVGDVVMLTYSVTVTDEGDGRLENVVTTDNPQGVCVPAPDQNPDCMTDHELGSYEVVKVSDPVTTSQVEIGDVVDYTVTVTHVGIAPVEASFEDDASGVLDDAMWNHDVAATAGAVSFDQPALSWAGVLNPGDEVTVTYSVTVTAAGDRRLLNVVTTPGLCVPAAGQNEACTTEHDPPAPAGTPPTRSLPYTGRDFGVILAAGLMALLSGGALLRFSERRRRTGIGA